MVSAVHCQHLSILMLALGAPSTAWQAACLALMLTEVFLTVLLRLDLLCLASVKIAAE